MTITPVTPRDRENLVPETTAIILDATEPVVSVVVDAVTVWSGGVGQNGWVGMTVVHPAGTRLILDPPAPFTTGDVVTVVVTGAVSTLTYVFAVGLRQITSSDDASVPRVTEGGPASPPPVTPGWWLRFDDVSGPPADFMGNYTWQQTGSPVYQQNGIIPGGKAVLLGGNPDAFVTSTPGAPPTPDQLKLQKFSISGWFNTANVGAQRVLASCGRASNKGWVLRQLPTSVVEFIAFDGVGSSVATSSTIVTPGQWHHVAVAVDIPNNVFKLYMNSNKEVDLDPSITSIIYEANSGTNDEDLWLGRDPLSVADYWQGLLDQWKYYPDTVLTDGQVSVLFQESTGPLRTPWIGYSREPGNIFVRKDEPLTSEVLMVPGDKVDMGYDETKNEIEILYIQNGKVFLVTGQSSENPSTLVQPSILKADFKTGGVGDSPNANFPLTTFPPIKLAVPAEQMTTGGIGDSPNLTFQSPPFSPSAIALLSTPVAIVITPAQSTLITETRLYKINTGASVFLASFPYSTDLQIFIDPTYVEGDRYYTQSMFGDPGASKMQRLAPRSADAGATPGDFLITGGAGDSPNQSFPLTTFPPLKFAIPTDGPVITGDVGHAGDHSFFRSWFPPSGTAAAMAATVDGYIVISGLTNMSLQHFGLSVTISGATNSLNNGTWEIVEIISATSVRVRALGAPGADANNNALTWSVSGPTLVQPASFITRNTLNIGVGS